MIWLTRTSVALNLGIRPFAGNPTIRAENQRNCIKPTPVSALRANALRKISSFYASLEEDLMRYHLLPTYFVEQNRIVLAVLELDDVGFW